MADDQKIPAVFRLQGLVLDNGWEVIEPFNWKIDGATGQPFGDDYGTGGNFGVGYIVKNGDRRAFLKAISLHRLRGRPDVIAAMKEITDSVEFERAIHRVCAAGRMDRVVQAIDGGQINLGSAIEDQVPYIILELADGDVRRRLRRVEQHLVVAWKLRALHHAAVGLSQLHRRKIAHQDLKPSNVMSFESSNVFKLGDFGRSVSETIAAPHDDYLVAGDPSYSPPELMYAEVDPDWVKRRLGCDVYMLGGLLCWAFLGQPATPLIVERLHPRHRPQMANGLWNGTFREVLPYVRNALTGIAVDFDEAVPPELRAELGPTFRQLVEPDPYLRGHPLNRRNGNQFSLERYISQFNRLAGVASRLAGRPI